MKYLLEALDWIKTNLDRLQTIGLIVVIVIALSLFVKGGCQRRDLVNLTERITTIKVTNTQLLKDIEGKDAKFALINTEIRSIKDKNTILKSENNDLKASKRHLEATLVTISDSLGNTPPDSSYAFITSVYDYEGELKYPINEKQVKAIHVTYLERIALKDLNDNLEAQVRNISFQLKFSEAINRKLVEQVYILKSQKEDYKEIISNKDEEIGLQEKQVKKERHKTVFFKITTGVAAGLAILIAL